MIKSNISRRNFLRGIAASAAVLPLSNYPFAKTTLETTSPSKTIEWGYPEGACRLNANENPLGPSPNALKAMEKAHTQAHRYTSAHQLRKDLASFHNVSIDTVLTGCGSTEFLKIAPWTFLRNGGEIVTALKTYKTLVREAEKLGVKIIWTPLNNEFSFDLNQIKKEITKNTKMVYIVNPNNPTGAVIPFDMLKKFCASLPPRIIIFIDEAYSQFLDDKKGRNGITLLSDGFNVIVSRTFSKVYGLAGLRLGYVLSKPSIIQELRTFGFRDMGVNQIAYAAGVSTIEDEKHIQKYKELIIEGKEFFYKQFDAIGLKYIPSKTPFVMVKLDMRSDIAQKKLASNQVYVRKGQDWQMPHHLRISMGFPEENRMCIKALKKILKTNGNSAS